MNTAKKRRPRKARPPPAPSRDLAVIGAEKWDWESLFMSVLGPDPSTRLVLVAIRMRLNAEFGLTAWPGQPYIAKLTGLKERAVRTHIAMAEHAGWITVRKRYNGSSIYTPTVPDDLVEFIKSKPWDVDPTWERPANLAKAARKVCNAHVTIAREIERPADIAKAPANLAKAPANNDIATGNICQSDRQIQPPKQLSKQLLKQLEKQLPNVQSQKATATRVPRYQVDKVEADRLDRLDLANHFMVTHRNWPRLQVAQRFAVHIDDLADAPQ
jgi:hypothetical protein